jgi:renalase
MKIAIIGAGLAGLACAEALRAHGRIVNLFDKGRGPGGRMSTRRVATALGEAQFDHGAQYFTARDPAFASLVALWETQGIAARWPAAGPEAWVGTPAMNAPIKALAAQHNVAWGVRIDSLVRASSGWMLRGYDSAAFGPFEGIVIAIPAEQVPALIADHTPTFSAIASTTPAAPCWTVMLAFDQPLGIEDDTIRESGPIGWAARNSAKPGRSGPESWVVQGSPEWSTEHLEEEPETVIASLSAAFAEATSQALPTLVSATAHRWRYARSGAAGETALWDASLKLGVCGDWLIAPRVECAWLSGTALGKMV